MKRCESTPPPCTSTSSHETVSVDPLITIQQSISRDRSRSDSCERRSAVRQQCGVDDRCDGTKETEGTVSNSLTIANGITTHKANPSTDHLSSYGFNADDWLNDSFTDENRCSDAVKLVRRKDEGKCTRSNLKIYEDHGVGSTGQNAVSRTSKNTNRKVLCDRTNVADQRLQLSMNSSSPAAKRTKENHKPQACVPDKNCVVRNVQKGGGNVSNDNVKLACRQVSSDTDMHHKSEACRITHVETVALSSAADNVTRAQLSVVTASSQVSSLVSSSFAGYTSSSSSLVVHSSLTSSRISVTNSMTSSLSSVTVCGSLPLSDSVRHRSFGNVQNSFSSSCPVPKLCPSFVRTPQSQCSLRSTCSTKFSTPGFTVTPQDQPVQNSSMRPTPPMCSCGCRAKRKFVQSPGQNMGRPFFCCGSSTRRNGCSFFKWENSHVATPFARSSDVTLLSAKQFSLMQSTGGNRQYATPLSSHAKQANTFHILVPPSFK